MDGEHELLKARYRQFADTECGDYSPHYARLARCVAEDDEILSFIEGQPDSQPNLFFASIQCLTGAEHMPVGGPELGEFVRAHGSGISTLMQTHRTQTNEIGRCTALLPALPSGVPLALIEVGASAGLCLLLDRYLYQYGESTVGDPGSPVVLRCTPLGSVPIPVPRQMPEIVWRRGLDLSPIDVTDEEAANWLLACIWSDQPERRERLRAAIEVSRSDPPPVVQGDLVEELPNLISQAPDSAELVVFHSATMPYVEHGDRDRFLEVLASESAKRPILWISNEGPGIFPSLDEEAPVREQLKFRLGRANLAGGRGDHRLVALAHYHGWDLEWLR